MGEEVLFSTFSNTNLYIRPTHENKQLGGGTVEIKDDRGIFFH